MLRIVLVLALVPLAGRCFTQHPFQATFLTVAKDDVDFFLDFKGTDILLSKFLVPCDASNDCQVVSPQFERASFNNTQFAFQRAVIRLCCGDGKCFRLPVLSTDLSIHVMGVNSQALWAVGLSGILRIDLYTGKTALAAQEPRRAAKLLINEADKSFYLSGFYYIEARLSHPRPSYANFHVKLQFPRPESPHDGNYFFLMSQRDLQGWDHFLRTMLGRFRHKNARHNLEIDGTQLHLDHRIFPSYDMNPFKRAPATDLPSQYTIGRYFIAKTEMAMYLRPSGPGCLSGSVVVTNGSYWYGLTLNPITCLQAAILFTLLCCGVGLAWRQIKSCTEPKDEDDYAHI